MGRDFPFVFGVAFEEGGVHYHLVVERPAGASVE
jgi:hypothetical protein